MDKSAPELKGFVLQMFDSKNWESFTRRNFATFPFTRISTMISWRKL